MLARVRSILARLAGPRTAEAVQTAGRPTGVEATGPPRAPRPGRVLLVGYYGCGLAGDEAILSVLVRDVSARYPGVSLAATTADPEHTHATFGVQPVSLTSLPGVAAAIAASDLVILGGGGLFTEYSPFRPLSSFHTRPTFNALCAEVPALCAVHDVPCVIFAAGVEQQRSAEARAATRRAFTLATRAAVRDSTSLEALADLGAPALEATRTCDPAATLAPPALPRAETLRELELDPARPLVTLSLRHWDPEPMRLSEDPQPWEALVAEGLTTFCGPHDAQLLLVPSQHRDGGWIYEDDVAFCERFRGHLSAVPCAVWTSDLGPGGVAAAIGLGDVSLAMRHHGVIFATAAGVPCAALTYATKVAGAMRDAGLGRFALPLATVTPQSLATVLGYLWRDAPTVRAQLETLRRERAAAHACTLSLVDAAWTSTRRDDHRWSALAESARQWLAFELDSRMDEDLRTAIGGLLHWAFNGGGSPSDLRAAVTELRARYPGEPAVAYYYGYVEAVSGGHLSEAARALSQAIDAQFATAWAYWNRAHVWLQLGQIDAARSDLEAALRADPTLDQARERLAELAVPSRVEP